MKKKKSSKKEEDIDMTIDKIVTEIKIFDSNGSINKMEEEENVNNS